jgi:DegV family protein with EDD domain
MMQTRVVTDSGADLAADVVERYAITVVPLVVRFGEQVYLDGQLSADAFWRKAAAGPHRPSTSQPSVGVFEETFARLVEAGHPVACLTLTSKHSGTFNAASVAARRFGRQVRAIDSLSLSLGQGFQVLAAARAAAGGLDLDGVARRVQSVRERTHLFILLDTIESIRRGGRADVLIPALDRATRLLRIKPILRVVEGQLSLHGLARSYGGGLARMRREVARLQPLERLGVIHARCPEVAAGMAHALAEELGFPAREVMVTETGAALSSHSGPRVVGVAAVQRGAG